MPVFAGFGPGSTAGSNGKLIHTEHEMKFRTVWLLALAVVFMNEIIPGLAGEAGAIAAST